MTAQLRTSNLYGSMLASNELAEAIIPFLAETEQMKACDSLITGK